MLILDENVVRNMLVEAVDKKVSDVFITAGSPVTFKIDGDLHYQTEDKLMPNDTAKLIELIFKHAHTVTFEDFVETGDCDFSISIPGTGRFRVNAFRQRNSMAAVIRVVQLKLEDAHSLGIPEPVLELSKKTRGLILVTGPAGSGKSTTLACLIDLINSTRHEHILTLEDPIEYLHNHKLSIVNQREMEADSASYAKALRASLRQSPDVILVGEMRDAETMSIAITAAETGHLVLSTLHTVGAAKTIDRIIDVFPPSQQQQIRIQLSTILQAVVSQQLIASPTHGRTAVFEVMMVDSAIRNLIRDSKTHQIDNLIHAGVAKGMQTMDYSIAQALKAGDISREDAFTYCVNPDALAKMV